MAQPHKGQRLLIASRPPQRVAEVIQARAAECDVSVSEYVAAVLAAHAGMPSSAPMPSPKEPQEGLPLTGT